MRGAATFLCIALLLPNRADPKVNSPPDTKPDTRTLATDLDPTYKLLLVEDERDLRSALTEYLQHRAYRVDTCERGDEVMDVLRRNGPFDLILLDIMLPGMSGFDVLEGMRAGGLTTPVIVLTARGQHPDVMRGFQTGADDYVLKPFSADVLEARIRSILARTKTPAEKPMDVHRFGDIYVNFSSNEARRNGSEIEFTALEYKLLRYLINNSGRVVSREKLLSDVWGLPPDVHTRTVDRHIASLRKKIEPNGNTTQHIQTVYGRGYRFVR